MSLTTKREIGRLKDERTRVIKEINELLDTHKHCDKKDCSSCQKISELGFYYEMVTARIRELRGVNSEIEKIVHQQIKNKKLTLKWLAIVCEEVEG